MKYRLASDKVIGKLVDGEAVIINLDTGMYFGLDGVAAVAWDRLSAGTALEEISASLKLRFPAERLIDEELAAFARALCEQGLLAEADAAHPSASGSAVDVDWPPTYAAPAMDAYDDVAEMVALDPPLPELSHQMIDQPRRAHS
ncbi:PqqD family protein [Sphingomonas sanxanigenens]|uniref:PqqD family protein n=1 Tax=Sphingomonas sanxanigenens DSM 19645 = NX02 TaxID=1123269 RepID=W0A5P9_9SPHN|nr:PqqD family protein [Sphingomonas sanxanigenens]AHE51807.1 hypothetical protein NX02_00190 [Sphingomonas sanxanigenens DSM 19645 = NX02]